MNKFNFGYWNKEYSMEYLLNLIITGANSIDMFEPDYYTINTIATNEPLKILDFGCGIGRNSIYMGLTNENWSIVGYDNETMIKHAAVYSNLKYGKHIESISNLKLTNDWEDVIKNKYDLVLSTYVLQHISECDLNIYLPTIKKITNKFIITSRRCLDEKDDMNNHKNIWRILETNGFLNPTVLGNLKYSVNGDLNESYTCVYNI